MAKATDRRMTRGKCPVNRCSELSISTLPIDEKTRRLGFAVDFPYSSHLGAVDLKAANVRSYSLHINLRL
jgi:hypothetical protein